MGDLMPTLHKEVLIRSQEALLPIATRILAIAAENGGEGFVAEDKYVNVQILPRRVVRRNEITTSELFDRLHASLAKLGPDAIDALRDAVCVHTNDDILREIVEELESEVISQRVEDAYDSPLDN